MPESIPASTRKNSRDSILDAAQQVTARDGAGNLTLDKVASECGLSKGGLLYNYPSKEALLKAMLERLLQRHHQLMLQERERLGELPNATLRAFLSAWNNQGLLDPDVCLSILAAAAQRPDLLEPLSDYRRRIHQQIVRESRDPLQALLLWAAADGIIFDTILGTAPYTGEEKQSLILYLMQSAEALA